jgi:ribosomal protein L44E
MAPNGLPVAVHPLCGICTKHQGSHPIELQRRNKQHLEQWQEDFERQQQMYEARQRRRDAEKDKVISELQATIEKLEVEIRSKPFQIVEKNLDQETVDEAEAERDKAYAARDRAYQALAELRVRHHDTGHGLCKCGKRIGICEDTEVLNSEMPFLRWEARQTEIARRRGEYASRLPDGHPGLINPRWSPPGTEGLQA